MSNLLLNMKIKQFFNEYGRLIFGIYFALLSICVFIMVIYGAITCVFNEESMALNVLEAIVFLLFVLFVFYRHVYPILRDYYREWKNDNDEKSE